MNSSKPIKIEDVNETQGIDIYIDPGKQRNTLSLEFKQRQAFFNDRPTLKALLERESDNPLLEEGNYINNAFRDRVGEHYLTYEAMTLLIEKKIRSHKPKKNGLPYNSTNIYVVKNNDDNFLNILMNLNLKNNEDAKIIYISAIHAIPMYLRNINGKMKCFIVDSEGKNHGWPINIINTLKKAWINMDIYLSSTQLQLDFYSCSTFAIKTLRFFVKHGNEIFSYLENQQCEKDITNNCFVLPESNLMPSLLKMCQSHLNLSNEALDSIVSKKTNTSLRSYWRANEIKGKNVAALLKKYKYLNELSQYIGSENNISSDNTILLPKRLQACHELYGSAKSLKQISTGHIVDQMICIMEYCDNNKELKNVAQEMLENIIAKHPGFIRNYNENFKLEKEDKNNYHQIMLDKLFFIAAYHEVVDLNHVNMYLNFSKILFILFEDFNLATKYLKRFAKLDTKQPIHDACLFKIPKKDQKWDKKYWAKLTLQYGFGITKYLSIAPEIEIKLHAEIKQTQINELDLIKNISSKIQYKNAHENMALADLCLSHKSNEKKFEKCLSIVKDKLKKFEFLPDIEIKGNAIDDKLAKYRFVKLPANDYRGLFLGEYTGCCQSIGNAGETNAIHGMTSAISGFYVILDDKDKIVGQSFAWLGKNDFIFDSWEYAQDAQRYLCKPFLEKAAEELIQFGFNRVLIGTSGRTPKDLWPEVKDPAVTIKNVYTDARSQFLIKASPHKDMIEKLNAYAQREKFYHDNIHVLVTSEYPQLELSKLISSGKINFTELCKIIKFFHIAGIEILHRNTKYRYDLIQALLDKYSHELKQLYAFENSDRVSFIDIIVGYDDLELLEKVIDSGGFSFKAEDLLYSAVKNDALMILQHIKDKFFSKYSWEEILKLSYQDKPDLLCFAIAANAQRCVQYLLNNTNDKNLVTALLNKVDNENLNRNIFFHITKNNAIASLKLIEGYYQDDIKQFLSFLNHEMLIDNCYEGVSFAAALHFDAKEVATLLARYYTPKQLRFFADNAIYRAIGKNNPQQIEYLRTMLGNEDDWHKFLIDRSTNCRGIITKMFDCQALDCVLYVVNSYKDRDKLAEILILSDIFYMLGWRDDYFDCASKITFKVFDIYKDSPNQLNRIIHNFSFFHAITNYSNIDFFKTVIQFLAACTDKFKEVDPQKSGNPLGTIISTFYNYGKNFTLETKLEILNVFFNALSVQQQKNMLLGLGIDFVKCEVKLVEFFIRKIDEINDDQFRDKFLSMRNYIIDMVNGYYDIKFKQDIFPLILEYYKKHKGDEYIVIIFKNNESTLNFCKHDFPMKYIFPYIRANHNIINNIFERITCYESDTPLWSSWFLEQKEISNELLQKSLNYGLMCKSKIKIWSWPVCPVKIWEVCQQRFSNEELIKLITDRLPVLFTKLVILFQTSLENISDARYYQALFLLQAWLQYFKKNNGSYLKLLLDEALNPSIFIHACEAENLFLIKLILLNCTAEERNTLIDSCRLKLTTSKVHIIQYLDIINETYIKLDHLFKIKTELCEEKRSTNDIQIKFFKSTPAIIKKLPQFLACADKEKFLYLDDKNPKTLKLIDEKTIQDSWDNLQRFLKLNQFSYHHASKSPSAPERGQACVIALINSLNP